MLLPSERIPLHIFEDRYRELIRECLAEEHEFGLVLHDAQGLREIGTRAAVTEVVHEFDDGRLNIMVEGRERFRIEASTSGRSFLTAEIEPVEDEPDPSEPTDVEKSLALFDRLIEVTETEGMETPDPDSPMLSFELAARVDFGVELKQELLELRSERERLHRLVPMLERAVAAIIRERQTRERASGNGKVSFGG